MDKTREILGEINVMAEENYSEFLKSGNKIYASALANCLDYDEQNDALGETALSGYLERCSDLAQKRMIRPLMHFNEPIDKLLSAFNNPKSGERMEARKELQDRFPKQDWKTQIAILTAMLQLGTKTDTAWVTKALAGGFGYLLRHICDRYPGKYDGFWELLYQRCDENYMYPAVAAYIVDAMPLDLVAKHQDELEQIVGYRMLCLRQAYDRDYVIDESKLTVFQYLDVLAKRDRTPKQLPVWEKFCEWLRNLNEDLVAWDNRVSISETADGVAIGISLVDIREVRWLVKSCGVIQLSWVISAIYDLDKRVRARLQAVVAQDNASKAVPYDSYRADAHYKELLVRFAKEEVDKMETSSLPKDITLIERLQRCFNRLNLVPEKQADGEYYIDYYGYQGLMQTNDFNNTICFKKVLTGDYTEAEFQTALAKVKEKEHTLDGEWTDAGAVLHTTSLSVYRTGLAGVVFRSFWKNFFRGYQKVEEELKQHKV